MSITLDTGRQNVSAATVDIDYSQLTSGVAANAIEMPADAVIVGGALKVLTPFNSATSDMLVVKDMVDDTILASTSIHASGGAALSPKGGAATGRSYVTVTWTGVGAAPTQGNVRLSVLYIIVGRSDYSQG